MKTFKSTLWALVAFLILLGGWYLTRPEETVKAPVKKGDKKEEGKALFDFEKANLVRIEVKRPDGTITLSERENGWWIEGEELKASRSMVNRVKHQLHDLVARATVVEGASGQDALYGLGAQAIRVTLTFRDGSTLAFDAGDPNPSGVSFYIRPVDDQVIYTVKKSAIDYYSLSLSEFRERRFATFDSKDVDQLEAELGNHRLKFQRSGEHSWDLLEPQSFAANDSEVRSLLGRVSAMKAIQFVADKLGPEQLGTYGLDKPRARISIRFSNSDPPLVLIVGAQTGEKDGEYPLTYAMLEGEGHVYAVRDGLVDDYSADLSTFRLTRFARMDANEVNLITATFSGNGRDEDLNGTVTIKQEATQWLWEDGVPVPGSTPSRVATRATGITSEEFIAEQPDDTRYGFDRPLVKIYLKDSTGAYRNLLIGNKAPDGKRPEGESYERYYARAAEFPEVYIIDAGVVEVVRDLMREHRRKAEADSEKQERQEKIRQELPQEE